MFTITAFSPIRPDRVRAFSGMSEAISYMVRNSARLRALGYTHWQLARSLSVGRPAYRSCPHFTGQPVW